MAKAGWYPAPKNPALIRYWDGTAWVGEPRPPDPAAKDNAAIRKNLAAIRVLLALAGVVVGVLLLINAGR